MLRLDVVGYVPTRPLGDLRVFVGHAAGNCVLLVAPKGPAGGGKGREVVRNAVQAGKKLVLLILWLYISVKHEWGMFGSLRYVFFSR